MGLRIELIAVILRFFVHFYPVFPLRINCMLTLNICVRVFSGSILAKILKHGIHMDNE